jgi:hypothetical protein
MWRAKLQKWCSNSLCRGSPHFLNATVALHKGRTTITLQLVKKILSSLLFIVSFLQPLSSLLSLLLVATTLGSLSQTDAQLSLPSPSQKNPSPQTHFLAISKPNWYSF